MENKTRILVVDDDHSVLEAFKMILEIRNYHVTLAHSLEEVNQIAKPDQFDAAFVDLRFNGKEDGINILKKLKEVDPSIEVVIVTAYASDRSKANAIEVGAMEYISKPFLMEEIYTLIDRALRKRREKGKT